MAVGPLPMCQCEYSCHAQSKTFWCDADSLICVLMSSNSVTTEGVFHLFSIVFVSEETWVPQAWCKKALFFYCYFGTHPFLLRETVSNWNHCIILYLKYNFVKLLLSLFVFYIFQATISVTEKLYFCRHKSPSILAGMSSCDTLSTLQKWFKLFQMVLRERKTSWPSPDISDV